MEKALQEVFDIRVGEAGMAQMFQDTEMPVGEGTVAPSVKDPQQRPGGPGEEQRDQVRQSRLLPDPPGQVKDHQSQVKDQEKNV